MAVQRSGSRDEGTPSATSTVQDLSNVNSSSIGIDVMPTVDAVHYERQDCKSLFFSTKSDQSVKAKCASGGETLHGLETARLGGRLRRSRFDKSSAVQCLVGILCFLTLVHWHLTPFSLDRLWLPRVGSGYKDASKDQCTSLSKPPVPSGRNSKQHTMNSTANVTLVPFTFQPLPLGSIQPRGWLASEMNLMADGLAGHEHDFYDIVSNSTWLGGESEYSPLNEGLPYWFNGLVPLAYGLDDSRLKGQVGQVIDYVLANQQSDGWLGPETDLSSRDLWGRFPLFLGMIQLAEADSGMATQLIPAMYRYVNLMHSYLQQGEAFGQIWGQARYADMIISLQWLYENYPQGNEATLLDSMQLLQSQGLDWASYFTEQNYLFNDLDTIDIAITTADFGFVHAVNSGQGLKTGAVDYRFTSNATLLQTTRDGVNWTFSYHGAASGTILGDERESGLAPTRGSELCTAVETMFSLSYLYQMMGDGSFADRCELAAFNALPVMLTPDNWAHQYIAEPNQPWSRPIDSSGLFWNVGSYGTTYGLQPNYPCCTVNHPQGYPKFLSASFVQVGQSGLAHALLSPARVSTTLPNGVGVTVICDTDYPFAGVLQYTINATDAFTFFMRIPQWSTSEAFTISMNGQAVQAATPDPHSGMISVSLQQGASALVLTLQPSIYVENRANSTVSIHHGSLLYALDVGETMQALEVSQQSGYGGPVPAQAHDYIMNSTLPWNFAIDPSTLTFHTNSSNSTSSGSDLPSPIWAPGAPPSWITAQACQIDWPIVHDVPAPVPLPGNRTCIAGAQEVILRPYGSLKLHMAEFPTVVFNSTSTR